MEFIVDACNLSYLMGWDDLPMKLLKEKMIELFKKQSNTHHIHLIFDGSYSCIDLHEQHNIKTVHTTIDLSADEWIIDEVRSSKKGRFTLITDDNEIIQRCKPYLYAHIKASKFVESTKTKTTNKNDKPETEYRNKFWQSHYLGIFTNND
jgi:hypothetical protein